MAMDWKSALSSLKDALPEGPDDTPQAQPEATPEPGQTARLDVLLDRKGRKGKSATIVAGFTIDDKAVAAIATKLKQRLGVGGSSRGGEILIQGDKRAEVSAALTAMGLPNRII